MIDGTLFEKLVRMFGIYDHDCVLSVSLQEYIARRMRRNKLPFGGIQVISRHVYEFNLTEISNS